MTPEEQAAAWETLLHEKLATGRLFTLAAAPDYALLGKRVRDVICEVTGLAPHKTGWLADTWWRWDSNDLAVADPTCEERSRDGYGSTGVKAVYRGKIGKRIGKAIWTRHGVRLSDEAAEQISTLVASALPNGFGYYFDFTHKIDWDAGDFGDHGSCYWNGNKLAKGYLMNDPTFLAMRFYAPEEVGERYYGSGRGVGRVWLLRRPQALLKATQLTLSAPTLFNGYWYANSDRLNHDYRQTEGNSTLLAAKVLAAHLEAQVYDVKLTNSGDTSAYVYINLGRGLVVAPPVISVPEAIDFEIDQDMNQPPLACIICGALKRKRYMHYHDGEGPYCTACFDRVYAVCNYCGGAYKREQLQAMPGDYYYCAGCYARIVKECAECHAQIDTRLKRAYTLRERALCQNCYVRLSVVCELCGGRHDPANVRAYLTTRRYVAWAAVPGAPVILDQVCHGCRRVRPENRCARCGVEADAGILVVAADGSVQCAPCFERAPHPERITANACPTCARKVLTPDSQTAFRGLHCAPCSAQMVRR